MSDASTNQPRTADVQQSSTGAGRHRGEVSTQDGETAPRGRHRKPVAQTEQAVTAA
ncbi:hypothetical protein [Streptomyces luteogriseus]|uniref:Uncharacterized protein n=1 Tax=Streptomyces luteogriseus TaxID=68233 RepID=A0A7W7DRG1_9ACTN|nr:hypothetical protein [Streptomyces luteogriseus]MBB4715598.1 hypothetical protein [Streptomyces luteogriseus]